MAFLDQWQDNGFLSKYAEDEDYGGLADLFLSNRGAQGNQAANWAPSYRQHVTGGANRMGSIFDVLTGIGSHGQPNYVVPGSRGGADPWEQFQQVFRGGFGNAGAGQRTDDYAAQALNMLAQPSEGAQAYETGVGSNEAMMGIIRSLLGGSMSASAMRTRFNPTRQNELMKNFDQASSTNPNIGTFASWLQKQGVY